MAKINIGKLKKQKAFYLFDLIIYLLTVAAIIALFLCVGGASKGKLESVTVTVDGKDVLTYYFTADFIDLKDAAAAEKISDDENTLKLKITVSGGYNEITVLKKQRAAYVSAADCSVRKDCVHTAKITRAGGTIICAPHKLVLKGDGGGVKPPITG